MVSLYCNLGNVGTNSSENRRFVNIFDVTSLRPIKEVMGRIGFENEPPLIVKVLDNPAPCFHVRCGLAASVDHLPLAFLFIA
jgi:hypothetical protein